MNVSQVTSSEVTYESVKTTQAADNLKTETTFKDILKNKTAKAKSDKGKDILGQKVSEEKTSPDDSISLDGNSIVAETIGCLIPINVVGNFFSQNVLSAVKTDAVLEGGSKSEIVPLSISTDVSGSQVSQIQQKVVIYTLNSLGLRTAEGQIASAEEAQAKVSEPGKVNNQEMINTADIKKDTIVFVSEDKSQNPTEKGSGEPTGKRILPADSNLTDEASEEVNGLNPFVFKPKEDVVNIKVAEPTVTKSWEAAAEDIGKAVVESVKGNKIEKLNISLNPKELGEIKVEFVIDNDKVTVSLICSNEKTKHLLSENTETLSKIVQSNLQQETTVSVFSSEKSSYHESNNQSFDGHGNGGGYKENSNQNNRDNGDSNNDFIQKLRLELVDDINESVNDDGKGDV